jgi:hypothetical protein
LLRTSVYSFFYAANAPYLMQSHQSCSEKGSRGIPLPGFQGCPLVFPFSKRYVEDALIRRKNDISLLAT